MLLRNGKYYSSPKYYLKKNIIRVKPIKCSICLDNYIKGAYITSCNKKNILKHSFHTKCLLEIKKHSNYLRTCPYCQGLLVKPIINYKISQV